MAQFILNQTDLEEIWFVISPQNPLKSMSDLFDEKDRIAMVRKAIENQPKFKASDVEFDMPRPSYTYATLTKLTKEHKDIEFVLLLGTDNLQHFDKWKNHEEILLEYDVIAYNREGALGGDFSKNQKVRVMKGPMLNISSTQIRSYRRLGKSIKYMVPEGVEAYLENME